MKTKSLYRRTFLFVVITGLFRFSAYCLTGDWNQYPTYDGYVQIMNKFAADYPSLCRLEELGTTIEDRKLLAVKISDNATEHEKEPALLYQSTIHGDEVCGYVLMLHLIDHLLLNYGKDSLVTKLVDNIEIWIDPLVNPDGTYKGGNASVSAATRSNSNGVDLNRSFPVAKLSDTVNWIPNIQAETKAIIGFEDKYSFVMGVEFHGGAEGITIPWTGSLMVPADDAWFRYIAQKWIASAQKNGPPGYFSKGILNLSADWYLTHGSKLDYDLFYQQFRTIEVSLSNTKLVNAADLEKYWNYQKEALLIHMEQSLFGIQGTVTDVHSKAPLAAKIFIENHDKDSSWVFSSLPHGDYYRPIIAGTYSVTFSAPGYSSKTVSGVAVQNEMATVLDVALTRDPTAILPTNKLVSGVTILPRSNGTFIITSDAPAVSNIALYTSNGALVRTLHAGGAPTVVWDGRDKYGNLAGNGCYVFVLNAGEMTIVKRCVVAR